MIQPQYAIHRFPRSVQLVARIITPIRDSRFPRSVQLVARIITPIRDSRFPRSVHLDARMIQPQYAIHRFPRSVQLVARMNHARYEIKCGDFCVSFFKQHIINRQERYSFRATSCTLRSTINPRTERYLTLFRHFRFRATSCTLRSTINPRTERYLTFSDIHNFVQQVARYDPRSTHARNVI